MKKALLTLVVFAGLWPASAAALDLFGQVVDEATNRPIEHATVFINGEQLRTDIIGMFELRDIDASGTETIRAEHPAYLTKEQTVDLTGDMTRVRLKLTHGSFGPAERKGFEVQVGVHGVISNLLVEDAEITLERFADARGAGEPAERVTLTADQDGTVVFGQLAPGFYRFHATHEYWEPITTPEEGTQELSASQFLSVGLEPVKFGLNITVKGEEPDTEPYIPGPPRGLISIENAIVEVTGVHPEDHDLELVAPLQNLTRSDGTVSFEGMPAVTYRVDVKKWGYKVATTFVSGIRIASSYEAELELELEDTMIEVEFDNDYNLPFLANPDPPSLVVPSMWVRILGVPGTETEDLIVEMNTFVEEDRWLIRVGKLLPGRYDILAIGAQTNVNGGNGGRRSLTRRASVDVSPGETVVVKMDGRPPMSLIRGQIRVVDDLREGQTALAADDRILSVPGRRLRIVMKASETGPTYADTWGPFETMTDEEGFFSLSVPYGNYGIEVPDALGYTGHMVKKHGSSASQFPFGQAWPYSQVWPYPTVVGSSNWGRPMTVNVPDYNLDLEVHRNFAEFVTVVDGDTSQDRDFDTLFLSTFFPLQSASIPEIAPFDVTWSGASTVSRVSGTNSYAVSDVAPGSYSMSVSHPLFSFSPVTVDVNAWGAYPGAVPPVDPNTPGYVHAGLRNALPRMVGNWVNAPGGTVEVIVDGWGTCDGCSPYNQHSPTASWYTNLRVYVELAQFPGVLWLSNRVPADGTATVWAHSTLWYRFGNVSPGDTLQIFTGGTAPTADVVGGPPGSSDTEATVYVTAEDGAGVDPGIDFSVGAGTTATSGGTPVPVTSLTPPTTADPRYAVVDHDFTLRSLNPLVFDLTVELERLMVVSGTIDTDGGEPVPPGTTISLLNAQGTQLAWTFIDPGGAFSISASRQTVWIRIDEPGYALLQRRLDPAVGSEDLPDTDLTIILPPSPTIADVTSNRFGIFLPGVLKSGDPVFFDSDNAKATLTATFEVEVAATPLTGAIDRFPFEPEISNSRDEIAKVWIVDRRSFSMPATEATAADAVAFEVDPVTFAEWRQIRAILRTATDQNTDETKFVAHASAMRGADGTFKVPLELWNLPPGKLDLVAVAVTDRGALAVTPFDPHPTLPLEGVQLGEFGALALNIIGWLGNLQGDSKLDLDMIKKTFPSGNFVPNPTFNGTIGATFPEEARPELGALRYSYSLGLDFSKTTKNSGGGAVSALSKDLGFTVGGKLSLKSNGERGEVSIEAQGSLTKEFTKKRKLGIPGFARKIVTAVGDVEVTKAKGTVSLASVEKFGAGGYTPTIDGTHVASSEDPAFESYRGKFSIGAFLGVEVKVNASVLTSFHPLISSILRLIEKADFKIFAFAELGGGGSHATRFSFEPPRPPESTLAAGATLVYSALGVALQPLDAELTDFPSNKLNGWAAFGVGIHTPGVNGRIKFGIENANDVTDPGVEATLNKIGESPFVKRIRGAFRLELSFGVNIAMIQFARSTTLAQVPFDQQFGTEPFYGFSERVGADQYSSPFTALPGEWINADGILVGNFFTAGGFDADHGLAFTNTDPDSGEMSLWWAARTGDEFGEPELVASGPAIDEVVVLHGDDTTLAWTELTSLDDIGNPFASSVLKAASKGDGWDVETVAEPAGWISGLSASSGGLAWDVRAEHIMSPNSELYAAAFDGSFSSPTRVVDRGVRGRFRVLGDQVFFADAEGALRQVPLAGGDPAVVFEGNVLSVAPWPGNPDWLIVSDVPTGLGVWDTSVEPWELVAELDVHSTALVEAASSGGGVLVAWLGKEGIRWSTWSTDASPVNEMQETEAAGDYYSDFTLDESDSGAVRIVMVQSQDLAGHLVQFEFGNGAPSLPGATPPAVPPLEEPLVDPDGDGDDDGCCRTVSQSEPLSPFAIFIPLALLLYGRVRRRP